MDRRAGRGPAPASATESPTLQAVATRARSLSRATTRSVSPPASAPAAGAGRDRAVSAAADIAPLIALVYGLSERERAVTRLCLQGRSTKEMAALLAASPYTLQAPAHA